MTATAFDNPDNLPDSWKPQQKAPLTTPSANARYGVEGLPGVDMDDPGQVEAWFAPGSYSHYEHFRKCVLAMCRELVRAQATADGEKLSEARIDDRARLHNNYLTYLTDSLYGRQTRETLIRQRMGV